MHLIGYNVSECVELEIRYISPAHTDVIQAKDGIQVFSLNFNRFWTPAFEAVS